MKLKHIFLALLVLCTGLDPAFSKPFSTEQPDKDKDVISLSSGVNCSEIANLWVNSYGQAKIHSGTSTLSKKELEKSDFTLVSSVVNNELIHEAPWKIVLAHNPIVPIISLSNPQIESFRERGLSVLSLKSLISGSDEGLEFLLEDNLSTLSRISQFSGTDLKQLSNAHVVSSDNLKSYLTSNPEAIGFIRLSEILKSDDNSFISGYAIIPIDKNNNGVIDDFEKIYQNSSAFLRGVWMGKYPRALGNDLYLLASEEPNEAGCIFISYLLEDGQKMMKGSNFIALSGYERIASSGRISSLSSKQSLSAQTSVGLSTGLIVGIILLGIIVIISLVNIFMRRSKKAIIELIQPKTGFGIESLKAPMGLYFDKSHTWAYLEKNGTVKIGVADFLLHVSGEITRINLKKAGDTVKKGEKIITLSQQGKHIHLKSPLSGTIEAENLGLSINPKVLNSSPFDKGWVLSIKPKYWQKESQLMLMADTYWEWINNEFSRLKEFLQHAINTHQGSAQVILQDGGEIIDQPLSQLGPEIWEDFQTQFIDQSNN